MNKKQMIAIALLLLFAISIWDMYTHGMNVFIDLIEPMVPQMPPGIQDRKTDVETRSQETIHLDATAATQLSIDNPYGRVLVTGAKSTTIQGEASITVYASSERVGKAYVQKLKVNWKKAGQRIELAIRPDWQAPEGVRTVRIDFLLTVPEGMHLNLVGNDHVKVEQLTGKVIVKNVLGMTEVRNVQNDVQIIQHQQYATAEHIKGNLLIHATESGVKATDVQGRVEVESHQGQVEVKDVQGDVQVKAIGSPTTLEGIHGSCTVNSHTGKVSLSRMTGSIKVDNIHSDVWVEQPQRDVEITVENGNVQVIAPQNHRVAARAFNGTAQSSYAELRRAKDGANQLLTGTLGQGQYELTIEVKAKGKIKIE